MYVCGNEANHEYDDEQVLYTYFLYFGNEGTTPDHKVYTQT